MNPKTTNLLLILLLLVGTYFVFFEWPKQTTYEREQVKLAEGPKEGVAVFSADVLPTELAESVSIQRHNETAELSKRGQDWFQTQPVRFELNSWSVRQMIDDAATLRYFQRFDPADAGDGQWPTLDQIHLSKPEVIVLVQFEENSTKTQEIRLGRQTIGGRGYLMINDDPFVYVVNDALHQQFLNTGVKDWRKRLIDAPTEGQAHRMTLTDAHQAITLQKVDSDWVFDSPHSGRVDRNAVKKLLAAIGQIGIRKFIADNPEDESLYGLDQPSVVLSIDSPEVEASVQSDSSTSEHEAKKESSAIGDLTQTLRIGAPVDLSNESYFASWQVVRDAPSVVFTLAGSAVEKFALSVDGLRDPRVTPIAVADVRVVTIEKPPGVPIKLVHGVNGWSFLAPGVGFEPDSALVSLLVESVVEATANHYEPKNPAMSDPVATVTLGVIGRADGDVLRIFPKGQGQTYPVLRNQETVFYHVDSSRFEQLFEPIMALRERTVLSLDTDTLTRLTIEHAGGTTHIFERMSSDSLTPTTQKTSGIGPAGDAWGLVGQDAFESEAFERLLASLSPLLANSWVIATAEKNPNPLVEDGGDDRLTIQMELAGGQHHTLLVYPDRFQGHLVGDEEKIEWFTLDPKFVELVDGEFRMRTLFPVNLDLIEQLQIIRGDKSVQIQRDVADQYVTQDGGIMNQSAAADLFDSLAGLRVDRFIEPKHISLPPLRMVIKMSDGNTHSLAFSDPNDPKAAVTNGGQWFTLESEVLARLLAAIANVSTEMKPRSVGSTAP